MTKVKIQSFLFPLPQIHIPTNLLAFEEEKRRRKNMFFSSTLL